jgi:hypothetical protein
VQQAAVPNANVRLHASHGSAPAEIYLGSTGTFHLPDTRLLLDSNGFLYHGGTPVIPGFTSWEANRIVVTNTYFRLPDSFRLNVTNDLVLSGTTPLVNRLEGSNCIITCGSLRLDKNVGLGVYGGLTDGSPDAPCGLVAVSGDMAVGAGAWVYPYSHPTNGGTPKFTMNNLAIAAMGGFDASGRGYPGGVVGSLHGKGPGGGNSGVGASAGGGGHGGFGGSNPAGYGLTNGLALAPLGPGSGGGGRDASNTGGNGGGLVRIEARGSVVVDGSLLANGDRRAGDYAAGGSGGGIFVTCRSLGGTGMIAANGEGSSSAKYSGGGGGGRVAVWLNVPESLWSRYFAGNLGQATLSAAPPPTFAGTVTAGIGANSRTPMPTVGTVVFLTPPPMASLMLVR